MGRTNAQGCIETLYVERDDLKSDDWSTDDIDEQISYMKGIK